MDMLLSVLITILGAYFGFYLSETKERKIKKRNFIRAYRKIMKHLMNMDCLFRKEEYIDNSRFFKIAENNINLVESAIKEFEKVDINNLPREVMFHWDCIQNKLYELTKITDSNDINKISYRDGFDVNLWMIDYTKSRYYIKDFYKSMIC